MPNARRALHGFKKASPESGAAVESPASVPLHVDVSRVDWRLLRRQKRILLNIAGSVGTRHEREAIQGVVHLIDHIQDEAARALGEKPVFG